ISPEQALEPREADVRSDIYSLGCTYYHLLTGQTPVPEGTAARKLHHHQYVAPLDPRQLNPEISDEVAAILARMMAKDPGDRYQRPEHLVQHLVYVARKLGAAAEIPDDIVAATVPLPSPPRLRPLLVAGAAAAILIGLVVIETMRPDTDQLPAHPAAITSDQHTTGSNATPVEHVSKGQTIPDTPASHSPPVAGQKPIRVHTASELAKALARPWNASKQEILVANDIDLTKEHSGGELPGLLFRGKRGQELVIRPASANAQPIIRWDYDASKTAPTWAALTIDGGKVTIERLRFQVDGHAAPRIQMMALRLQAGQLYLKECTFVQMRPAERSRSDGGWLASVAVEAGARQMSILHGTGCCFLFQDGATQRNSALPPELEWFGPDNQDQATDADLAGQASQVAVRLEGSAQAEFDNCGFGPHATLFQIADKTDHAKLTLRHCSALLTNGVAFQVDDGTHCPLNIFHSLFAHPARGGQAVLVRTTRRDRGNLYTGTDNGFYNLTAFCQQVTADGPITPITAWDDFKTGSARSGDNKDASRVLDTVPWSDRDPLQQLRNGQRAQAFRLDPQLAQLRETGSRRTHVIGVEQCLEVRLYPSLPPLPEATTDTRVVRIVSPHTNDSANGIYKTLNAAILDAHPGDEIQIRSNEPMNVDPIALQKANCDLTIRPGGPDYHPILQLGEAPTDTPASIFRLYDGKLHLIDLEFRLKPELRYLAPAVVTIAGSGQCTFRHCVLTLDASNAAQGEDTRLAAVVLADPKPAVKMDGSPVPASNPSAPVVELDGCFVRGTGDLLAVRSSRPVIFNGTNSVVALDGSLLTVRPYANSKDMLPPGSMQLTLRNLSAYLYDSLIRMRTTNDGKDLLPVTVSASDCIVTAATDGKAVVHFDGDMSDQKKMQDRFSWDGSNDVCSRFEKMFEQQVSDDSPMMNLPPVGMRKWMDDNRDHTPWVYKDSDRVIGPQSDDDPLTLVGPREFKVRKMSVPQGCGADLTTVAQPATETRSDARTPASKD
ncbi:MAG TPA: hypothetical protein VFA18_20685, partial [Gemmataceae bacterium]|nr:hypothetical protein [Gemmataceae bacterium]